MHRHRLGTTEDAQQDPLGKIGFLSHFVGDARGTPLLVFLWCFYVAIRLIVFQQ